MPKYLAFTGALAEVHLHFSRSTLPDLLPEQSRERYWNDPYVFGGTIIDAAWAAAHRLGEAQDEVRIIRPIHDSRLPVTPKALYVVADLVSRVVVEHGAEAGATEGPLTRFIDPQRKYTEIKIRSGGVNDPLPPDDRRGAFEAHKAVSLFEDEFIRQLAAHIAEPGILKLRPPVRTSP